MAETDHRIDDNGSSIFHISQIDIFLGVETTSYAAFICQRTCTHVDIILLHLWVSGMSVERVKHRQCRYILQWDD